jgi:hypothetical protein
VTDSTNVYVRFGPLKFFFSHLVKSLLKLKVGFKKLSIYKERLKCKVGMYPFTF